MSISQATIHKASVSEVGCINVVSCTKVFKSPTVHDAAFTHPTLAHFLNILNLDRWKLHAVIFGLQR